MMLSTADFVADAAVSICGALGAAIVLRHLGHIAQSKPVARGFRFCLWILIVLMCTRVGHWGNWGWFFAAASHASAAILPVAALLLAEVLLRCHAPPWLKKLCAGSAVVLVVVAFIPIEAIEFWHILALLVCQISGLTGVAWFVVSRDRASLSDAENRAIDQIALSFLLILPFVISDYMRNPAVDIPVRLGGLAVLALCWLSIGFRRSAMQKRDIAKGFGGVVTVSLILTLMLGFVEPITLRGGVQITVVLVAAIMLLAIWQASMSLDLDDSRMIALREMSQAHGAGDHAGLELLRKAAGAPEAVLIVEDELADFDVPALRSEFTATAHRHNAEPDTSETMNWLFSRFGATHAVALKSDPLTLVMLNNPAIATADQTGAALGAIVRMAVTLSQEDQPC